MSDPIGGDYGSFEEFCSRPDPEYPKGKNGKYRCPCCLCYTLDDVACYDICPVCFWEDDGTTGEHGFSPNGGLSLEEGRQNYKQFGASMKRDLQYVRTPEPGEL